MPPVPLAARVVEVIAYLGESAAEPYRYGSGFIVRGRTALTAAHVVADAVSLLVRDPDKRTFPASADPRFTGDANGPGPDMALIEIHDPELDLRPVGLARVDRDSATGEPVRDCQVIGYPAFKERDTPGGQVRETADASGHVPVLEGLAGGLLSVEVTRKPRPLPPKQTALGESEWSGMSGAPVLAGGLLLGVVSEHAPREGSSAITAIPLTALEADPAHPGWGPGVTDPAAWWARLGVPGIGALRRLPPPEQAGIPLPAPFEVRRPRLLEQVIGALLADLPQPGPVGLVGMGGSGKSVLAAAAARDPRVRDAFPDGRFWLQLGPDPPLLQLQASLAAALGDSTPVTDVPQGRAQLSRLLAERRCLLVLDNVWAAADLAAFAVAGPAGRVLVTTRDAAAVAGGTRITLDELAPEAALQLLAGWTATPAGQLPAEAALVAQECGYLPLALALCGAMIADGDHGWPGLLDLLRRADLGALHSRLVDYPHRSLAIALGASLASLPPDARARYLRLAVFNAEGPVPQAALQLLWGLGPQDTAAQVVDLAAKSLLRAEASRVSLHDLQMDYLTRLAAPDLPALHNQLLVAYATRYPGGWPSGPDDGYFYQHLTHHLHQAKRLAELKALLLDLDWMTAKLAASTIPGLLADYDTLPTDPTLRLVTGALRLSARVLADDPGQLSSQLTGRLTSETDPQLRDLLQRTRQWPTPWLRPLTASLKPAGGPLLRTLTGDTEPYVYAVAISRDGRRAISGGTDRTVRVWDLDTGAQLRTLTGHDGPVHDVAVSADGRRAVSGDEEAVRVWDLDTGEPLRILTGHTSRVNAVAISADGRRAVSGSSHGIVRVWDLDTGEPLRTLTGAHGGVTTVAISADGRRVVSSGYYDPKVGVWDLDMDTGEPLRTLTGHAEGASAVAISADGRRVISGGFDPKVRVWDLDMDTGEPLRTLTGHAEEVTAVAISADGRRAVSGSVDRTVRVWDLDTGAELHTLTGHDTRVHDVVVSADGRRAVSSGNDWVVRVWDTEAKLRTLSGHAEEVTAVAVSADGRRAISGGNDRTVRVWDLDTGAQLRTLTGHAETVTAVAVSADGRRAISGGDAVVRVWDLETGVQLPTLTSHDGRPVAISADGRRAVTGGRDGTVRAWDLDTGAPPRSLAGHAEAVSAVAISADGRCAISGGYDGAVRVWDLSTSKVVASASQRLRFRFTHHTAHDGSVDEVAVSADGRRGVSRHSGGETVRVWDLETGAPIHTLTIYPVWVNAMALSADGRCAIFGGFGRVEAWDLDTGAVLRTLIRDKSDVRAVAVSADGRRAFSSFEDGTVRVWDLAHDAELASFVSDSALTALAATPSGMQVIVGTSAGPVHLLEVCGYR